jgi:outer membrane protein assembly factor BamB
MLLMSFRQADGSVVWARHSFPHLHSSPVLITVDGQEPVVALMGQQVLGVEPNTGEILWQHPHQTPYNLAIGTLVWGPDNILIVSSAYDGGRWPAQITGLDVKSGDILWQSGREFAKAQLVLADGKLLVLDQDGVLALASPSPKGLRVHARVSLLQSLAWTPPTLVGTRLYIRDRKSLIALDLGQ